MNSMQADQCIGGLARAHAEIMEGSGTGPLRTVPKTSSTIARLGCALEIQSPRARQARQVAKVFGRVLDM